MAIQLKAGMRLKSQTDTCEVVVVKAPPDPVDLRCGGHPVVAATDEAASLSVEPGFAEGTQLGKRYADEELGLELLCSKAGAGSLSVGEAVLELKGAKPLPASD